MRLRSVCCLLTVSLQVADFDLDQGRRAVYGTADGVYLSNLWENREPTKVLALLDVTQIDVLEDYQLLIVLSGINIT